MCELTRRTFLASAVSLPLSFSFAQWAQAQTPLKNVRYDVRSPQGAKMLDTYAKAVAIMKQKPEGDPTGWVFQWYSHWVKGNEDLVSKEAELNRIYPQSSVASQLASDVWDTCHSHAEGMDENMFLPWHRIFLHYFERIIRTVSGDASFTSPYWNYSAADPSIHGILPEQFRMPGHPLYGSLYVKDRKTNVNAGKPIDGNHPNLLSTSILAACDYDSPSPNPGFCIGLDTGLHGEVHVLVGNNQNMGSIPWAANDPIFWLHHCNIDRLWASWSNAGRVNPKLTGSFTFADENGNRTTANVADFLELAQLDYTYDQLESVAPCPKVLLVAENEKEAPMKVSEVKATPINLGPNPVEVTLEPIAEKPGQEATTLGARASSLAQPHALYLVLKDLHTNAQPGVLYDLYLDLPANSTDDQRKAHYVGTFNFFHAHSSDGREHGEAAKGDDKRFISFDITSLAKTLHEKNLLNSKPKLTIVPADKPEENAKPVVGEVSIIQK